MVDNILYEETEARGVYGIWMRARRGALGYRELVTAPKYCGNGLLMRINGRGSSIPTTSIYATNEAAIVKQIQGDISDAIRDSYCVLSVMQLMFLIMIPKN